jgi:2-polyprenyl-6-methoxyphenol hydroxylase-like FAD-dependent oxidoreductase
MHRSRQTADHADVRFADGDVRRFPFVIGADGIHSQLRASVSALTGLNSPGAWRGAAWCRWNAYHLDLRAW